MSHQAAVLSALSAFALLAFIALVTDIFGPDAPEALTHRHSGEPITLESVKKDLEWHSETARKLRERD